MTGNRTNLHASYGYYSTIPRLCPVDEAAVSRTPFYTPTPPNDYYSRGISHQTIYYTDIPRLLSQYIHSPPVQ